MAPCINRTTSHINVICLLMFGHLFTLVERFVCVLSNLVRKFTSVVDASPQILFRSHYEFLYSGIIKFSGPFIVNVVNGCFNFIIKRCHW